MSVISSLNSSNALHLENRMDLKVPCLLVSDLSLMTSLSNRFLGHSLKHVLNRSKMQYYPDQIVVGNDMLNFMNNLLKYFLCSTSLSSQRFFTTSRKELMQNLNTVVKYISFTKAQKEYFLKIINDLKFISCKNMYLDHMCNKLSNEFHQPSVINMFKKANITCMDSADSIIDSDFKAFVSVLDQDYTKSSKGYSDRKIEHDIKIRHGNQNTFNCLNHSCKNIVIDDSDLDDYSQFDDLTNSDSDELTNSDSDELTDSDESYDCVNPSFDNVMMSRYFNTLPSSYSESESSQFLVDCDYDDYIVFTNEVISLKSDNEKLEQHNLICSDVNLWHTIDDENISKRIFYNQDSKDETYIDISPSETSHSNWPSSNVQGFENPCFENFSTAEYGYLKMVNDNWKIIMEGVSDEPREAKKVSFLSLPNLVSVHTFEPEEDDESYCYSSYVLDTMRFRNRILDFEIIMTPFLVTEHRTEILKRNKLLNG